MMKKLLCFVLTLEMFVMATLNVTVYAATENPDTGKQKRPDYIRLAMISQLIEKFEEKLKSAPNDEEIKLKLARLYANRGKHSVEKNDDYIFAAEDVERAVELNPNEPIYRETLVRIYLVCAWQYGNNDEYDKAITALNRAEHIFHEGDDLGVKANIYEMRSTVYIFKGEYNLAIEGYHTLNDLIPNNPKYREALGSAYFLRGLKYAKGKDYQKGLIDLKKAVELCPNNSEYQHMLQVISDAT